MSDTTPMTDQPPENPAFDPDDHVIELHGTDANFKQLFPLGQPKPDILYYVACVEVADVGARVDPVADGKEKTAEVVRAVRLVLIPAGKINRAGSLQAAPSNLIIPR